MSENVDIDACGSAVYIKLGKHKEVLQAADADRAFAKAFLRPHWIFWAWGKDMTYACRSAVHMKTGIYKEALADAIAAVDADPAYLTPSSDMQLGTRT